MRSQWMLVPVKPNEAMIKGSDFVVRRSAIETWAGYLGAVPEAPKGCLEQSLGFLQGVMDWNRAQPKPPIAIGQEYSVATALLGMIPQYDGKAVAVVEVWNAGTAAECVTADLIGPPLADGTKLFLQSNASEVDLLKSVAESLAERLQAVERERDQLLAQQGLGAGPATAKSSGFADSARALREHESAQWLGSKGHHTGFVAAAVFLEKLAEQENTDVIADGAVAGSGEVVNSAPGAALAEGIGHE